MTPKSKNNLSLLIFIILAICLIVFLIYPLFIKIRESSKEIFSQKSALISLENKIKDLRKFQTRWQEIKPNLEKIDKLFINPKVPVEFINFLETTAENYEIPVKISLVPSKKIEGDLWPSISFQISSTTSFSKISRFLDKLESSPYLIEIQNLNVRKLTGKELKPEEETSLGSVEVNFLIKVYTK